MQITLIFVRIISFMLFTVLLLLMYFILDFFSRLTLIHDLLPKSVGPVPFSTEYLICRHVRMDGLMDGRTRRLMN